MKLNIRHKKTKTKTDKQKRINAEKKSKGPKLLENYMDNSYCDIHNTSLNLTQMRYGTIDSCDVDILETSDGNIEISNSWLEVLLIMLSNVINSNPDSFKKKFEENAVTNMFFIVDKVYGKYSFDKEQYKAYKIPDTEYYLEYLNNSATVFEAILGLTKCLEISLDGIKFHLMNKVYKDLNLKFKVLEETESIVGVNELRPMLKPGMHMIAIEVLGDVFEAHSIEEALILIYKKLLSEYGVFRLSTLNSNESTGIKILEDGDEVNKNIFRLSDSEIGIYSDRDKDGIVQFLIDSVLQLELGDNQLRFKFKSLTEKKEWELD